MSTHKVRVGASLYGVEFLASMANPLPAWRELHGKRSLLSRCSLQGLFEKVRRRDDHILGPGHLHLVTLMWNCSPCMLFLKTSQPPLAAL